MYRRDLEYGAPPLSPTIFGEGALYLAMKYVTVSLLVCCLQQPMTRDVFKDSASLLRVRVHKSEALLISCYLELTPCREDNFSNALLFCWARGSETQWRVNTLWAKLLAVAQYQLKSGKCALVISCSPLPIPWKNGGILPGTWNFYIFKGLNFFTSICTISYLTFSVGFVGLSQGTFGCEHSLKLIC